MVKKIALFAESVGRIVLEVAPEHVQDVLRTVPHSTSIGTVTAADRFVVDGVLDLGVGELVEAFTRTQR